LKRNTVLILFSFIILFVLVRSLHFVQFLNFSHDQGDFALKALNIYREKKITLVGPTASPIYMGHRLISGSAFYYVLLFVLLLGHFDPIVSSYIFMLLCAVMIVPLYFGVKYLANKNTAYLIITLYTLLPFYVTNTRFLTNPTLQFWLTPLLILFMGLYNKTKNSVYFFLVWFLVGFLLLFHFQFALVLIALIIYYLFVYKINAKLIPFAVLGFLIGISNLILFELKNNYYDTRTALLLVQHLKTATGGGGTPSIYFLSISLFLFIFIFMYFKNQVSQRFILEVFAALFILSLFLYIKTPSQSGDKKNWNYLLDSKANSIIESQKLSDFSVVNLVYDTDASVQKYLLAKDNINGNFDNYSSEKYLFVITKKNYDYLKDPAYEVNTFKPSKVVKSWNLNSTYVLDLRQRTR